MALVSAAHHKTSCYLYHSSLLHKHDVQIQTLHALTTSQCRYATSFHLGRKILREYVYHREVPRSTLARFCSCWRWKSCKCTGVLGLSSSRQTNPLLVGNMLWQLCWACDMVKSDYNGKQVCTASNCKQWCVFFVLHSLSICSQLSVKPASAVKNIHFHYPWITELSKVQ